MSTLYQCNTCKGTYLDFQADGSPYAHVCPPVRNTGFQPLPAQPKYDPREFIPQKDFRDENVELTGEIERVSDTHFVPKTRLKSEGKGRTKL